MRRERRADLLEPLATLLGRLGHTGMEGRLCCGVAAITCTVRLEKLLISPPPSFFASTQEVIYRDKTVGNATR